MPTSKQIETIKIGAFFYNGAYRAFHTSANNTNVYPVSLPVWEATYEDELEFVNDSVTQSLAGNERGNPSGYRATVNLFLDNSYPEDSTNIRTLLDKFANQFDRTVLETNTGTKTAVSAVLTSGVSTGNDSYYNNLVMIDASNVANQALITAYNSATKVATATVINGITNIANSYSNVVVVAKPNIPTVLGVSTDDTEGNLIYCNLTEGKFGFRRELTVNMQSIQLTGREIQRTPSVSDKYRVG
jgi:hypothetical protein